MIPYNSSFNIKDFDYWQAQCNRFLELYKKDNKINPIDMKRTLVIIRVPLAYKTDELHKDLIELQNEFCFIILEEDRVDVVFEYPKNYISNVAIKEV